MKLSELSGKEIIHIQRAERMGVLGETDVEFDPVTGAVKSVLVPLGRWGAFSKGQKELAIPWQSIRTIGDEMILIDQAEHDQGSQSAQVLHTIEQKEGQIEE
ncbi:YlmC/YmxH family sporulation protein [Jeotgalibacillus proteolyticus]|uniref:YlmC/YmxH family sporulation protein n=1 Tax=Jeotgalibacillus proteolyticus TaxID=2082395 RepID=A0A2S5GGH4_9BACL|nr:YlmC/YmxH family sporulation protein [Jeotgalibacillus proteolyticus]PPA72015.1 YlmC/YmxH family sporulation protein [Jeotgalibacillus proteolyticus]